VDFPALAADVCVALLAVEVSAELEGARSKLEALVEDGVE
jgi:hypothetical protein